MNSSLHRARLTLVLALIALMVCVGSVSVNAQLPVYIPAEELVAYHDFNGNFDDKSKALNKFTNHGVLFETGTSYGKNIVSARFNGTPTEAMYLEAENPLLFRSDQYTYAVRFKVNEFRPLNNGGVNFYYQSLLAFCPPNWTWGSAYALALHQMDNSAIMAWHWMPNQGYGAKSPNSTIKLDTWYTAVVSYDGSKLSLYVDGQRIAETIAELDYANQIAFVLGGAKDGTDGKVMGGFSGNIDEFAFWRRALSQKEIEGLFVEKPLVKECRNPRTVASMTFDAREEATQEIILEQGVTYKITGSGEWSPNGGFSRADCEWEYLEPCVVRNPSGGLRMGFDLAKIEQDVETLQPVETSVDCIDHSYTYYVTGTDAPLYLIFRDRPYIDNSGMLNVVIEECLSCSVSQPADSILGYRATETHQVVTYALRNNPDVTYQWIASGGYLLGETTNHYCDVIWGYGSTGSVCCIVSDSSCTDTICVDIEVNNKTTGIAGDGSQTPQMSVQPNPTSDMIDIASIDADDATSYTLLSVTGELMKQAHGVRVRMNVEDVPSGVYHVIMRNVQGSVVAMQRVVVQR